MRAVSSRLLGIAAANAQIVADGAYTAENGSRLVIGPALDAAIAGSVSHPPEGPAEATGARVAAVREGAPTTTSGADAAGDRPTTFEVKAEDSLQAARRLRRDGAGRIAVLNFASA